MAKEFVDRILKKLFGNSEVSQIEELPPIKEKLIRGDKFVHKFQEWRNSDRVGIVLSQLSSLYQESRNDSEVEILHIHKSPQANGFFFDERAGVKPEEFSYILDHFKMQALDSGYTLYSSEKKYQEKTDSVQVVERHYLKPALDRSLKLPIDQRYGNILLEYVSYNDKPAYLKVMASSYSDRNYSEVLDFQELVSKLFSIASLGQ